MSEPLDGNLFGPGQSCFGCAADHPIGFHLKFERDGDDVITRMTPGEHYQGAPGIMHGGLVATLADELAAWACIAIAGKFGVTVSFDARYLQAVRIGKEIEGRAHIVKSAGRFIDIEAKLLQEERPCFTAALRFLLLDKSGMEKMLGRELPEDWNRFTR
jgi:acyl-coenzyme A thioesterase PaaI-like protein